MWRVHHRELGKDVRESSAAPSPFNFYSAMKCTHRAQDLCGTFVINVIWDAVCKIRIRK